MVIIENYCLLCKQPLRIASHGICSLCVRGLPALPPLCLRCATPLTAPQPVCGGCLHHPPPWQRLLAVTDYRPPLSGLVHRLKDGGQVIAARALSRLLLLRFLAGYRDGTERKPDTIISVPLHRRRQWRRGFNQSELIARPLAAYLGCRYDGSAVIRTRDTLSQRRLSRRARLSNPDAAFALTRDVCGEHIAVVDDVITTGATMTALSALLIRAGAATVRVWCICRTL